MALTADRELFTMFPNIGFRVPMRSDVGDVLYKGAFTNTSSTGDIVVASDTTGQFPAGIVEEQDTVVTGTFTELNIIRGSVFLHTVAAASVADIGKAVYATADDTLALAATYVGPFGFIVGYDIDYPAYFWIAQSTIGPLLDSTSIQSLLATAGTDIDDLETAVGSVASGAVKDIVDLKARWAANDAAPGQPFSITKTFTSAAAATAVEIVPAVAAKVIFITSFLLSINSTVAWTDSSGTIITLEDDADTPVVAATFAKAQLTSQAQLGMFSAGVTLGTPIRTGVGLTAAKALNIIADSDFDAGSDITITVTGFVADA